MPSCSRLLVESRYILRMKRITVLLVLILFSGAIVAAQQSVGGGISVFVPMSMLEGREGSISLETAFSTGLGLGPFFSVPVGVAYNQVWGMEATTDGPGASGPWFYGDSLAPFLMLKTRIPVGPLYVEAFGGGVGNYNFSVRPLHDRIARDLQRAGKLGGGSAAVAVTNLQVDSGFGLGYTFGGGAGVTIGQVSVGVSATYRHIWHSLRIRGDYFTAAGQSGTFDTNTLYPDNALRMAMRGISFSINGSFAF